jgi:hypothetical protein
MWQPFLPFAWRRKKERKKASFQGTRDNYVTQMKEKKRD